MASSKKGVHLLAFPFPAQGHMLPLLDLAYQLSLKGLTITILVTPRNLPFLTQLLCADPSIQTLVLPFPSTPLVPDGVENVKDIGNHGNLPIIKALSQLKDPIIHWFSSQKDPPLAILSDFFLGWTHHLALQLKVPRITFYTSGAFLIAVLHHLWGNSQVIEPGFDIKFQDLPGEPSFPFEQLPSVFRRYKESCFTNPGDDFIKNSMAANNLSWASVFNTFEALEDEFLYSLRTKMGNPSFFSVGPLHLLDGHNDLAGGSDEQLNSRSEVLSWLDRCGDGSVLYVCFGSQKLLNNEQMDALAEGLDRSGVKFIWVVKSVKAQQIADGYGTFPAGFEDRVMGRGYILKGWAPQSSILNHHAVGGFLSHCGWNSVLEAVGSGVMLFCWPMEADQFVNDKLMVDYMGAAVRVCQGANTIPDSSELAQTIAEWMNVDGIERFRAKALRVKALEALEVGGSSCKDLDGLVKEIAHLGTDGQFGHLRTN